jgi:hypothetical protein
MNIALIVGCARSGTSILGELIASFPGVRYVFEAHQIWDLAGLGVNSSHRLEAGHATPAVVRSLRQWAEEQQGVADLLVEKCPRNTLRIPFLREVFPEAKLIHIVRDGRDVACSMNPGIGGAQWNHLKPPSWQDFSSCAVGPVRCALAWREIMEIALEDLVAVPHVQIRYEDLVQTPITLAQQLGDYLGLKEGREVSQFCLKIRNSTRGSYHADRQVVWYKENHQTRIGRWRENLTRMDQERISELLTPLLQTLGYDPSPASGQRYDSRAAKQAA